jgi:hypothetical protein
VSLRYDGNGRVTVTTSLRAELVLYGPQFGAGFVNDKVDKSDGARDGRNGND